MRFGTCLFCSLSLSLNLNKHRKIHVRWIDKDIEDYILNYEDGLLVVYYLVLCCAARDCSRSTWLQDAPSKLNCNSQCVYIVRHHVFFTHNPFSDLIRHRFSVIVSRWRQGGGRGRIFHSLFHWAIFNTDRTRSLTRLPFRYGICTHCFQYTHTHTHTF